MNKPVSCDIFCTVVDNYGDIGVCWRLARQLAHEHGVAVRLWVDDLASFCRLCPEVDAQLAQQHCRGVEVRHWVALFPEVEPADLVIEAFACDLPQRYVAAMAAQQHKPVWINLEYLSAEDWVEGCHKLPSPHPSLPLVKHFFFPGFTPKTGGLLLERDLLARRDAFQSDPQAITAYWKSLGIPASRADETRVSLFSYENSALPELLRAWEQSAMPISCLVPEGRALPQVAAFFGQASFDITSDLPACGLSRMASSSINDGNLICINSHTPLLGASRRKKVAQHCAAFIGQHPAFDARMMVQLRRGEQVEHAACRPGFGVARAVYHACYARMEHGAHAHHARLQRDEHLAADQPVIAQVLRRVAQGQHLCVGGWIVARDRRIEAAPDDLAILHHHRADRHFAELFGLPRQFEGEAHIIIIRHLHPRQASVKHPRLTTVAQLHEFDEIVGCVHHRI